MTGLTWEILVLLKIIQSQKWRSNASAVQSDTRLNLSSTQSAQRKPSPSANLSDQPKMCIIRGTIEPAGKHSKHHRNNHTTDRSQPSRTITLSVLSQQTNRLTSQQTKKQILWKKIPMLTTYSIAINQTQRTTKDQPTTEK